MDLAYQRLGGLEFALNQRQLNLLSEEMAAMAHHTHGAFKYSVLDREAALALQPGLDHLLWAQFIVRKMAK